MTRLKSNLNILRERIRRRPTLAALAFALLLTATEAALFQQNYASFFENFSLASPADARRLGFVLFALAALVFFVRSTLVSRFGWQCVYFAVFAFALSVEYGFHGALGRFTLPGDFENTFYASDASDKTGAITLFFNWLVVVPLTAFRLLFYFSPKNAKHGGRLFAANLTLLFGGFLLCADFYRAAARSNAFAAHFSNLANSALYFGETKLAPPPRQAVKTLTNAAPPANNVVLIVDESVRADHLSVNGYERQTTPTLDRLARENLLKNWGVSVSGATESVGSNRLLLTGLTALPDRENRLQTLPTIFQYARAAGYRTFYFDGQDYAGWIGSGDDRRHFGRIYTAQDFPHAAPFELDAAFAAEIDEIVRRSTGNFIWVNKRGAHFRYEKNYPTDRAVWTPTDLTAYAAELATNRPLENNYDNAILYNSESFFGALFARGVAPATVFAYTSDHGQTLVQDRATHAGDSKAEATVPILLIGDDERLRRADSNYAAAHRNLFPTLLDLMNYPKDLRAAEYAPSLLDAKAENSAPRFYFVGNLRGAFGGKKMLFDEHGE